MRSRVPTKPARIPSHVDQTTWEVLVEGQKRAGIRKLKLQLDICEGRVRSAFTKFRESNGGWEDEALLLLDAETYYTIAYDLLKLACILSEKTKARHLKAEPTYKIIAAIRSHLVRHAYDKSDGDPFHAFSWSPEDGPMLKKGSPLGLSNDPGFFRNVESLADLNERYDIELLAFHPAVLARIRDDSAKRKRRST